ncbi:uncharacterized protein EAF01_007139 [Botrytis porri]|uniref:Uncharacterized protein n=1 Tax=Botrytis porri TaxID=87229 RepID=A0A4Z1KV03_9HELO|nr:uncharacterized protein EAF01_007139 [Botrytis porri]KAF7901841.1 hypothetical protein EAF01_007139 [Botrytis porri]TGO88331.1 hypothetical protein BPOR_0169g00100 [Botrytis porri]
MSHRSGHQNVNIEERRSGASQATSIDPKKLECYSLSPGNHYTLERYSSKHKMESLRGTKYYVCQLSDNCKSRPRDSLKDLEEHVQSQHMEPLCGFIGRRLARQDHVDMSQCHEGSERRRRRKEGLTSRTNAEEQKRFKDGERRRAKYEEEDRLRMSGNGKSAATSGSLGSGGKRRA